MATGARARMAAKRRQQRAKNTAKVKAQQQNAKIAKTGGYTDKNKDSVPDIDPLERERLAEEYKSAIGIIYSVPEIQPLFEKAVSEQWAPQKFISAVQESNWYRSNNQYARQAWAQETIGGADWGVQMDAGREAVRQAATQMGSSLTEPEVEALARRYVYEGWYESSRSGMLAKALSEKITYLPDERGKNRLVGGAGALEDNLRDLARSNGVYYSDNWYLSAARSVASGLSTADTWERDIRETAASTWAPYADQIRNGMNVYDLASPYINRMAQEFEVDPSTITLEDPYIISALTNMDDKGNPMPQNLWDFQKKLRNDPRWLNTSKAQNEVTSVTGRVMQMFGLMAG